MCVFFNFFKGVFFTNNLQMHTNALFHIIPNIDHMHTQIVPSLTHVLWVLFKITVLLNVALWAHFLILNNLKMLRLITHMLPLFVHVRCTWPTGLQDHAIRQSCRILWYGKHSLFSSTWLLLKKAAFDPYILSSHI